VARALETTGANPRHLCLEITEAALITDIDAARRELAKLHELGVRLAVDDFGTGFSSVGYVRQFPIDSVKIDKSFVQGLMAGAEDAAIAQAIIKMAHALGLTTVAEGVETADVLARLEQLGCDYVQGYYFAAPLAADAVDGLLQAGREVAVAS
jgi:EAL domain-containing protein (putative c-di-GMP-specific phosphodiesterase class I)